MNALITMVAGVLLSQAGGQWGAASQALDPSADQLVPKIVELGYQRIGVLPYMVVTSDSPGRDVSGGKLDAQSNFLATSLRRALAEKAHGRFQVLEGVEVDKELYELQPTSVGQPENLRKAAQRLGGLDAILFGTVRDLREMTRGRPEAADLKIVCRLVDVKQGSFVDVQQDLLFSIAGAAYAGESFELRRWEGRELTNVGFHPRSDYDWAAPTDFASQGKYKDICRKRPHPAADGSTCPFGVTVRVDDEVRRPIVVGRDYHVPLEAGDTFAVRIDNRSNHDIHAALFVDGINVLGKRPEHPGNCKYWFMTAGSSGEFSGWYTADGTRYLEEPFRIGQADNSVAVQQGHLGKLGQITAVFYTVGQPQREATSKRKQWEVAGRVRSEPPRRQPDGSWAVSAPMDPPEKRTAVLAGPPRIVELQNHVGERPGLILAAITLHYSARADIEDLQRKTTTASWPDDPDHQEPTSNPSASNVPANFFAAIAFSRSTWSYGWSTRCHSQEEAKDRALAQCRGGDAQVVTGCYNGWCALALGARRSAWGYAGGNTFEEAMAGAESGARQNTSRDCHVTICVSSSGEVWPAGSSGTSVSEALNSPATSNPARGIRFGVTAERTSRGANAGGVEVTLVIPTYPGTQLRGSDGKQYCLVAGQDVITHVNGRSVTTYQGFCKAIDDSPNDLAIRVHDTRSGTTSDYSVDLSGSQQRGRIRFGVTAEQTPRSTRIGGVEVTLVIPSYPGTQLRGSDGEQYYLVAGRDIVTHINGRSVTTYAEFVKAVDDSSTNMTVRVYDARTGSTNDYDVTLRD